MSFMQFAGYPSSIVSFMMLANFECGVLRISRGLPFPFNFASSEAKLHNEAETKEGDSKSCAASLPHYTESQNE